jgi:hypothetical protein
MHISKNTPDITFILAPLVSGLYNEADVTQMLCISALTDRLARHKNIP